MTRLLTFLEFPAEVAPADAEAATVGQTATVRARVFNQFREEAGSDARVGGGTPVTFRAEHSDDGADVNPHGGTVQTDSAGEAAFTFTTDQTGTVTVTLSLPTPGGQLRGRRRRYRPSREGDRRRRHGR